MACGDAIAFASGDKSETLRHIAEFRSPKFRPMLPDECQVNPQVYGAELAFWLAVELAKLGVATSYPSQQDRGWYIGYSTKSGAQFAILCCNIEAATDRWLLSLRRHGRKMFGRDKPPFADARLLVSATQMLLENEASISKLAWLYEN